MDETKSIDFYIDKPDSFPNESLLEITYIDTLRKTRKVDLQLYYKHLSQGRASPHLMQVNYSDGLKLSYPANDSLIHSSTVWENDVT